MAVIEITKDNFEQEVKNSDVPVVVDFWASWCGPCMSAKPMFEKLSDEFDSKLKFCSVNVEDQQALAFDHQVSSIPCFITFYKGDIVDKIIGAMPEDAFKKALDEIAARFKQ